MPELLLELGVEELPASFVERAFGQLRDEICRRLTEAHLTHGETDALGTPRRLIIRVQDVAPQQPDRSEENRGPALKSAYDADGNPTKALEGFCRGQGVTIESLRKDDMYVWATKHIAGRPTSEVLAEILPASIRALTFDKSMRWGANRMRFARPILWILAAFDGAHVPFSIETVSSGLKSRGHRFNAPEEFEASTSDSLLAELRSRQVEPDPKVRRDLIIRQANAVATGTPEMSDALIDENVYLTEWPQALEGEFKADFMVLPEPVLITAMAKHERFFPVRGTDGKLTNRFISIRNGGQEATVRSGNAWVLNARFNDAKFFFDEDQNSTLDDFLAKTERMLFQEKLGSVRQRADRLSALAAWIWDWTGGHASGRADVAKAGLYLKADLSSGLVSELSSLQGVIGGEYARSAGMSDAVCDAIATQYAPDRAKSDVARCAIAADQLDKLAGYLGLGLAPTGSSDPYGLRRAVTVLIDLALGWPGLNRSWLGALAQAMEFYAGQGHALDREKAEVSLAEIFVGRYKALMPEARYDLLEAAVRADDREALSNPRAVRLRLLALQELSADHAFVQTATRPLNIVAAAEKKGVVVSLQLELDALDSAEGTALANALSQSEPPLMKAIQAEDPAGMTAALRGLSAPINAFFDSTMVMVDDARVRDSRLALLKQAGQQLLHAGDWTLVVVE